MQVSSRSELISRPPLAAASQPAPPKPAASEAPEPATEAPERTPPSEIRDVETAAAEVTEPIAPIPPDTRAPLVARPIRDLEPTRVPKVIRQTPLLPLTVPRLPDAPAATDYGTLTISAEPEGALFEIYHPSYRTAVLSPATITDVPVGEYRITVRREGHRPKLLSAIVRSDEVTAVGASDLERTTGGLDIRTTPPADYELLRWPRGETPTLIEEGRTPRKIANLPTGKYTLVFHRSGWQEFTKEVEITDAATTEFEHTFQESAMSLTSTPSGAEVWLRGPGGGAARRVGQTPFHSDQLPVGDYAVTLKHRDGPDRTTSLRVAQNALARFHANWAKIPVEFTSDPAGATLRIKGLRLSGEKGSSVTPMTVLLNEGDYRVTASFTGLDDREREFTVAYANQPAKSHFQFSYGLLMVQSTPPGARIYFRDQVIGHTPMEIDAVPPGHHEFRLSKERYAVRVVGGTVKSGGRLQLSAKLHQDPQPHYYEDFTNHLGQRMRWIAAIRGWAAATETTQAHYDSLALQNPSEIAGANLPVTNVTWTDAMQYCELLNISERGQGLLPTGYAYTLPTDAQWSAVAEGTPASQAITSRSQRRFGPSPVASLAANRFGLHDVRGNVWEWCRDWYSHDIYVRERDENHTGEVSKVGSRFRVLRGGSWNRSLQGDLQTGYRKLGNPRTYENYETGFRVVLVEKR